MAYLIYLQETLLPSVDLVKSVRAIVRHLHYFINCVGSKTDHPLEEILRYTIHNLSIYVYINLRIVFNNVVYAMYF